MDEPYRNPYVPAPPKPPAPPLRFFWRDWVTLALAVGLSLLFFELFGVTHILESGVPALGITLFVWALFAAVFFRLGRRAFENRAGLCLSAAVLAVALSFTLHGRYTDLTIGNCFLVLGLGALAIFQLSGLAQSSWRQVGVLWETIALSFIALFSHPAKPFRALGALWGHEKRAIGGVLIGLAVAVPLLGIAIPLLQSADTVFAGLVHDAFFWFEEINAWEIFWRVLRTLALGLLLFSALFALNQPQELPPIAGARPAKSSEFAATIPTLITVLALLNVVYFVFVAVQFAFLFGGAAHAAMKGGWAEYARSGFFQLVAVAALNLAVVLTTSCFLERAGQARPVGKRTLQALAALLLLLTGVILFSALRRMGLYIGVYGLSLLRVLTLFGMAFIAICLAAAFLKLLRPGRCFFPVFLAAGVGLWVLFSFFNTSALIANYNVDAYLDGRVAQIDTGYLMNLGPESLPALRRLNAADPASFTGSSLAAYEVRLHREQECVTWREWTLSDVRNRVVTPEPRPESGAK